jgi:hypothetical protein
LLDQVSLIRWAKVPLLGALLVSSGLLVRSWLEARDARVLLQAELAAQKAVIDRAQQQINAVVQQQKDRDAALQQQLQGMQAAVAQIKTAADIARWIPTQLPTQQPINIHIPPATPQNPTPDAVATIPQADLPAIRDAIEGCKECEVTLATAQQDLVSRDHQLKLVGEQLSATQRQRDVAVKAANGGGFWVRVKRGAKWFVIGGAIGYVAARSHR